MLLNYQANGNLVPGIHEMTWDEFVREFGHNMHRQELINGLKNGIIDLKKCGCSVVYVDGSFVTKKVIPNDFDICWDPTGVNLATLKLLFPIFFDFSNRRENQKKVYRGEFFPSTAIAEPITKELFLDFFQHDKDNNPKGIVKINI